MKKLITVVTVAALIFAACKKESKINSKEAGIQQTEIVTENMVSENGQNPDELLTSTDAERSSGRRHVYIESNDAMQNKIIIYEQQSNGTLKWMGQTNSGGNGAGSGLGSQGALALDKHNGLLFAVNAGSNSVSSFKINHDGTLELRSTESTHGQRPISVTTNGQFVYVVNGMSADIYGYKVGNDGKLNPIDGSHKELSAETADPAQISFTPSGHSLMVTEKGTNKITAFSVKSNGAIGDRVVNPSVGTTPFGFDFARREFMLVTNADGGMANTSTCTAYKNLDNLTIKTTNGAVPNGQTAVCWVAVTENGRFAFTTNTGSNTLTTYFVDNFGRIYFIPWSIEKSGDKPIDVIVSSDNRYVYNINGGSNSLGEYRRGLLGTLQNIGYINNIPDFAAGLASY
jgi:6-phosphogluconolactonase